MQCCMRSASSSISHEDPNLLVWLQYSVVECTRCEVFTAKKIQVRVFWCVVVYGILPYFMYTASEARRPRIGEYIQITSSGNSLVSVTGSRVLVPVGAGNFSPHHRFQTGQPLSKGYQGLFPWG